MNIRAEPMSVSDARSRQRHSDQQLLMLYRMRRSAGWSAFFTLVIAIGLVAGAYFSWQQFSALQHHLGFMYELSGKVEKGLDGAAKDATAALQTAQALVGEVARTADAATRLAAAVEQGNEIFSAARPLIAIDAVSITPLRAGQAVTIKTSVRNFGRSSASAVGISLKAVMASNRSAPAPDLPPCQGCPRAVLLPQGVATAETGIDAAMVTVEWISKLANSEQSLVLLAHLDYRDLFQNRHATTACMVYVPASATFGPCGPANPPD